MAFYRDSFNLKKKKKTSAHSLPCSFNEQSLKSYKIILRFNHSTNWCHD
jgi:hypothetical protein